jgi:hypothetical protein
MILSVINEIKNKKDVSYKADINDFESICTALELEEYVHVKYLALEQIKAGYLDPRYVIYAGFGCWYESTSFDINSGILSELIFIHQFYLEKIKNGQVRSKLYSIFVEWLHTRMFDHAKFIKQNKHICFEGDRSDLSKSFDKYISFIKLQFSDISLTELYQLKELFNSFRVKPEKKSLESTEIEIEIESISIESSLNFEVMSGNDEWSKLMLNIQIYRKLINDGSWLKAAVVYQAIDIAIKQFNPIKYFPDTFYPYLRDTAKYYNDIMHQLSLSEHPLWTMLSEMFNSSPQNFTTDESLGAIGETLSREINNI